MKKSVLTSLLVLPLFLIVSCNSPFGGNTSGTGSSVVNTSGTNVPAGNIQNNLPTARGQKSEARNKYDEFRRLSPDEQAKYDCNQLKDGKGDREVKRCEQRKQRTSQKGTRNSRTK